MAAEDVAKLRRLTGEPGQEFYNDALMESYLTAATTNGVINFNKAALAIWIEKAGRYASMADVVESGSERKLSQLYRNANGMVERFTKLLDDEAEVADAATLTSRVVGVSARPWGAVHRTEKVLYGEFGPRGTVNGN